MTITSLTSTSGYVGRTGDGRRVYLEIELRPQSRGGETVEHEQVPGYTELSICGSSKRKHSSYTDSGGQIVDELRQVIQPADGWTRSELHALADVWDRWHLNGMKAGCAHMPASPVVGQTECPVQAKAKERDENAPKPYRHGTAWLIEPLPDDVINQVRRWAGKLDGAS